MQPSTEPQREHYKHYKHCERLQSVGKGQRRERRVLISKSWTCLYRKVKCGSVFKMGGVFIDRNREEGWRAKKHVNKNRQKYGVAENIQKSTVMGRMSDS